MTTRLGPLRTRRAAGALVAVAVCVAGCGGPSPEGEPLRGRLQRAVDDALAEWQVPGASVAVIDHDRHVEVVSGTADRESHRAVTVDTQFRVASVTKMYVAAIALRLVDRGVLSLDDPIGELAGDVPDRLAFVEDVTLRQLLSHTTGLPQTFTRDEDRHSRLSLRDRLERIPPAVCDPGTCWSYADGNYVLAQVVLETASGRSLSDLFQDELIEPLGLGGTVLLGGDVVDERLPPQYALSTDDAGRPLEPPRLFEQSLPRQETLVMTARDAARFAAALFGGDVLDPARLEEMLDTTAMRALPCPNECPYDYGLGVFHFNIAGHAFVGHDGTSGTVVVHDASRDLTIAILTNGGERRIGEFLASIVDAVGGPRTRLRSGGVRAPLDRTPSNGMAGATAWRHRPCDSCCASATSSSNHTGCERRTHSTGIHPFTIARSATGSESAFTT